MTLAQPPVLRVLAGTAVLALALSACGATSSTSAHTTAASGKGAHDATITITAAKGCVADHTTLAAGGITFNVTNTDATAVSEVELLGAGDRIMGEKENLPPGLSGTFSVNADAGTYTLYCPGGSPERTVIKVTGTSASTDESTAALLKKATQSYGAYVNQQGGYLLTGVERLDAALHGTSLVAAQNAYKKSRAYYEKIEPVAESFSVGKDNLDADIDARANDVPAAKWEGFHRIEKGLFLDKSLRGLGRYGDGLVANVKKLQALTKNLTYQPTELANGAQELLDEVASSKITGEEERYSHIDMLDFSANVEGSQQAFAQLLPVLDTIDSGLADQITARFNSLVNLLDHYRSSTDASGFVLYGTLTTDDKKQLAASLKAVQEPLGQIAAKVATAG